MAASSFFELEFEHELMFLKSPDFLCPDLPPLPGCEAITSSDLAPLPDSLCEFPDISNKYCWPDPIPDPSTALVPYDPAECNLQSDQLALDDIDLDYFAWNTDSTPPCSNDNELQYHVASNNDGRIVSDHNIPARFSAPVQFSGSVHGAITWPENSAIMVSSTSEKRPESSRSRLNDIGFDEMKNYFYMPITKAAKEMNVGLTVLKKRCRELGISRWPHRKMKSLKSLIHNVQELGQGTSEETIRKELLRLDEYRRMMEENPEMQLTERTKKLRQACFKANYKRRRLIQDPSCFDIHRRCSSFPNY